MADLLQKSAATHGSFGHLLRTSGFDPAPDAHATPTLRNTQGLSGWPKNSCL